MRKPSLPRLADWLIATIVLTVLVGILAPHQVLVSLYKLSLLATAGVGGYWLDRALFPYARPDRCLDLMRDRGIIFAAAMLRRALIVAAAMIAVGLGA